MMLRKNHIATVVLSGLLGLALSGCDSTKSLLGLEKSAPDEFTVVSKAPLTLPPDYTLRPPAPGSARPNEVSPRDKARQTLTGRPAIGNATASSDRGANPAGNTGGEQALLANARAEEANPRIREIVNAETEQLAIKDSSFVDRLLFWQEKQEPGMVINARAEQQRLQQNAAEGKAVTEGETISIERRERGILEGIF
ncbi:DUF3035 domain-containing protein [Oceanibacterium hippocampi]|uniref:Beta-barrel assembly machine subunit BamF n=1 Tax=Oceanibacterium hippocampi TaxID=745714 RepID=A0A1Y5S5D1_9PROT|nr:DUF3035 domain-containing protein [Oceanibacterium hippocampi]SLN32909.1 hypothetical protein OCH7691_01241 [Oceanibacterium hippocampi]